MLYNIHFPDESKFGKKMLEKMGWTDGKGLGADESGETAHIKVKKRAANLGKSHLCLERW